MPTMTVKDLRRTAIRNLVWRSQLILMRFLDLGPLPDHFEADAVLDTSAETAPSKMVLSAGLTR
jgi:hypothetical protein